MEATIRKPDEYVDKRQEQAEHVSLDVPCGSNALKYPKPAYTAMVEDQEEITAMSYQEYYALHKKQIDEMAAQKPEMKFLALMGLHKAGKRAEEAMRTRGIHWRESDKLREDDKHYIEIAEKNLALLKERGISLEGDPEQVLNNIKTTFGKIGEEIVTKARRMPIYREVIDKEDELQCGDRLLDKRYENDSVRALRGGEVLPTAILHLTTIMTGQGVSDAGSQFEDFDAFIKATVEAGSTAFSTSDDTIGLMKRNVPAEEIEQEKKQGNFAIGSQMFTRRRHEETPTYYLLAEQLDCVISLSSEYAGFKKGNAPEDFSVDGVLSITQQQSEVERGVNKMVHITLYNGAGEEVYSTTPITNRDGNFTAILPKELLDKLEPGNYKAAARFSGPVRGENLDCPNEVEFTVVKEPTPEITVPAEKKEPMQVYARMYSPRRSMDSAVETVTDKKNIGRNQDLDDVDGLWEIDESKFPNLGKVSSPMCHDQIEIIKDYVARKKVKTQDFKFGVRNAYKGFGIHGTVHVTAMERERHVNMEVIRHPWGSSGVDHETVEESRQKTVRYPVERDTETSVGVQVGKEVKLVGDDVRVDLEGRVGKMFGPESRILGGLQASVGNSERTNQLAIEISNELHKQASLALTGTAAVVGGLGIDLSIDLKDKPVMGIGLRYTFR